MGHRKADGKGNEWSLLCEKKTLTMCGSETVIIAINTSVIPVKHVQ